LMKKINLFMNVFQINGRFEFTNMECIANDQKFGQFEYCYLKSVNRTYKYASMKYLTSQTPFNNIVITVALMKRLNGYKPFLYDFSFDYCRYMRNPENPGNKVITFFYSLFKPYSNINHTCPYTHDLIVDKVPISYLNHKLTELLPLPEGNYRITTNMIVKGIKRTNINIYFKIF
ncbi:hypothetical protein KR044_003805, partial [Drosophila immigrans]